jgi:hypothetical protein
MGFPSLIPVPFPPLEIRQNSTEIFRSAGAEIVTAVDGSEKRE